MRSIQRVPEFELVVRRQDFSSPAFRTDTIISFSSVAGLYPEDVMQKGVKYPGLLSYNFTETLRDPTGGFSFICDPNEDKFKATVLDVLTERDLVYISEHGVVRYVGVINSIRYASAMADGKVTRSIVVSGYGIGGILAKLGFVLDQYLLNGVSSDALSSQLFMALSRKGDPGTDVSSLVEVIVQNFLKVQASVIGGSAFGLGAILSEFFDYKAGIGPMKIQYPFAFNAYQVGLNTLWTILAQIFPPPIYELFGAFDDQLGSYKLVARTCPFDDADWAALPLHTVDPLLLVDHDLGVTDEDVYSMYIGLLPGSGLDRNGALTFAQYEPAIIFDEQKWQMYGYKPLYLEWRYFDHTKSENFNAATEMQKAGERLKNWYKDNADMYSGTIKIMNYVDPAQNTAPSQTYKHTYPRIGERLAYVGGQFYIESTTRSWSYGGPMETTLNVNRGLYRGQAGQNLGKIPNVGRRMLLIEKEKTEARAGIGGSQTS